MALENDESPPSPRKSNRFLLIAGVAGACALGAGAGLWARPADVERDPTLALAKPPEPPKRTGRLQIVLDDSPAPIGKPIEVLPGSAGVQPAAAPAPVFITPEPEPEEMAPRRPLTGLVKVQAVSTPVEAAPPAPRVDSRRAAEAQARRDAAAEQARLTAAKAEKARLQAVKLEKAHADKLRLEKATADKAAKAEKLRIAKAEKAVENRKLAERAAKAKAEKIELAKAARRQAEATRLAEEKRANALRRLAHAVAKVVPHRKAEPARVELAQAAPPKARKPSTAKKKCVSPDPGAAIVCADPTLASADRQLSRAYRDAAAAGVDAATLERQQQRWLSARSAAAREAPWAVHDVYLARIAELNDLARDARGGGY